MTLKNKFVLGCCLILSLWIGLGVAIGAVGAVVP